MITVAAAHGRDLQVQPRVLGVAAGVEKIFRRAHRRMNLHQFFIRLMGFAKVGTEPALPFMQSDHCSFLHLIRVRAQNPGCQEKLGTSVIDIVISEADKDEEKMNSL
jgi:hypothetical protein